MSTESPIKIERAKGWATVLLNRPARRNAVTGPMMDALADAVDALSADAGVAAIVLRGAQGAFCSGVDLTEMQHQPPHSWVPSFHVSLRRAHLALFKCACPIVVALERFAINGGAAFALAADVMVAGKGAFVQIGEIRQGAPVPMNMAWLWLKSSESVQTRMALLGDRVGSDDLLRLGLAAEVADDTQVRERAEAIATHLAACPPGSARQIKAAIRATRPVDPEVLFSNTPMKALLTAAQVRQ